MLVLLKEGASFNPILLKSSEEVDLGVVQAFRKEKKNKYTPINFSWTAACYFPMQDISISSAHRFSIELFLTRSRSESSWLAELLPVEEKCYTILKRNAEISECLKALHAASTITKEAISMLFKPERNNIFFHKLSLFERIAAQLCLAYLENRPFSSEGLVLPVETINQVFEAKTHFSREMIKDTGAARVKELTEAKNSKELSDARINLVLYWTRILPSFAERVVQEAMRARQKDEEELLEKGLFIGFNKFLGKHLSSLKISIRFIYDSKLSTWIGGQLMRNLETIAGTSFYSFPRDGEKPIGKEGKTVVFAEKDSSLFNRLQEEGINFYECVKISHKCVEGGIFKQTAIDLSSERDEVNYRYHLWLFATLYLESEADWTGLAEKLLMLKAELAITYAIGRASAFTLKVASGIESYEILSTHLAHPLHKKIVILQIVKILLEEIKEGGIGRGSGEKKILEYLKSLSIVNHLSVDSTALLYKARIYLLQAKRGHKEPLIHAKATIKELELMAFESEDLIRLKQELNAIETQNSPEKSSHYASLAEKV